MRSWFATAISAIHSVRNILAVVSLDFGCWDHNVVKIVCGITGQFIGGLLSAAAAAAVDDDGFGRREKKEKTEEEDNCM